MNKLKMKAKAGVTLVELLVVILIVTILSVSMLPLLQPFVTEAQYAAEPIPVIGNLRTKIGLYMYDKGSLPTSKISSDDDVHTWVEGVSGSGGDATNIFTGASYKLVSSEAAASVQVMSSLKDHLGALIDVDFQDLRGRRSNPAHYHYYKIPDTMFVENSYVIGCFGDGNGLKSGTGYAVCELNFINTNATVSTARKYIGTWRRYKTKSTAKIQFSNMDKVGCFVPTAGNVDLEADSRGTPKIIGEMEGAGWEF